MAIQEIIRPMNKVLVRDAICEMIAKERDNQIELYSSKLSSDFNESEELNYFIEQNVNFNIYPKRFRFPEINELPCVFVYFNEAKIPPEEQNLYENFFNYNLQVEYYTGGINEEDEDMLLYTADEKASDRFDYLTSQLYNILFSEPSNVYNSTDNLVKKWELSEWKRVFQSRDANSSESILGGMFIVNVGIEEPTFYQNTFSINEFYSKLKIRDEFCHQILNVCPNKISR